MKKIHCLENDLENLTVQAVYITNALKGVINSLYFSNLEDTENKTILIATSEALKCLAEKHADDLEKILEV
ncbi:hypothetical protein OMY_01399 [Enterococcus sulfureus ATCC 49903]|uniref:Uncharacterized protein n=1 Tax=Enterococcus sulfureus ATCC 49903 TaxID=1140003 RepID=S0L6P3_9ENTE|nr:hypothetical protein [Enterococcus sulfureus]EOT47146.1 hypothetical protein OMY_01399 [Enterococcus sulfureus ATCC 49903]EOT83559.1 hypothetical protein I573_01281 [Enterococcus sulfureus ATCC 49903]